MAETKHKKFFHARRILAFLPLLLLGLGVWYSVHNRTPRRAQGPTGAQMDKIFNAAPSSPAGSGAAAARLPEAYDPKGGIDIEGSPEFKSQVTHALKLIWLADRKTFFFLKKNLHMIRNETQTGFYMENGLPVAALSKAHAFRSLTWCAGIIAHQSWHAWHTLAKNKKSHPAPPLPGEKDGRVLDINPARFDYKGLDVILYVENKASAFQLDVLKKVGAPAKETGPVSRRAPRDFQHAHDGNYALTGKFQLKLSPRIARAQERGIHPCGPGAHSAGSATRCCGESCIFLSALFINGNHFQTAGFGLNP